MPLMYTNTYTFPPNSTGAQGVLSLAGIIKLSDVFGGSNIFYTGTTFSIEESVTIISNIDDYSLLREEDRWFSPKQYIGTWQRIDLHGLPAHNNVDYGLIRSKIHRMTHTSLWTIGGHPDKRIQQGDGGHIRQCNFALISQSVIPIPGSASFTAQVPYDDGVQFIFENFVEPAQLEDKNFYPWFAGLGLYFYDGMSGNRIEYQVSVINAIYNGADPYITTKCPLGKATCDESFNEYVLTNNGGLPIDSVGGTFFSSAGIESGGINYLPKTYQCPNSNDGIRNYFRLVGQT